MDDTTGAQVFALRTRRVVRRRSSIGRWAAAAVSRDALAAARGPDGRVALAFAAEHAPDVVLPDFNMPGCDGRCFLEGCRALPGPRAPVVLVTASRYARQRATEVGADEYLGKPV